MENEAGLTLREREVLEMLAAGLTDGEIAAARGVKRRTVSHCVSAILLKLGARNRAQAVARAFRVGILHSDDRERS